MLQRTGLRGPPIPVVALVLSLLAALAAPGRGQTQGNATPGGKHQNAGLPLEADTGPITGIAAHQARQALGSSKADTIFRSKGVFSNKGKTGGAASGGGSDKRASPQQVAKASKRLAGLITFLTRQRRFTRWIRLFQGTGLNNTVAQNLQLYGATLFVPNDAAFAALPAAEVLRMRRAWAGTGMLQLLAFHVWFPAHTVEKLSRDTRGTQYSTADYPQRGLRAYKLLVNGLPQFNGRPSDRVGVLGRANFYYESGPPTLTVFEATRLMTPIRYF